MSAHLKSTFADKAAKVSPPAYRNAADPAQNEAVFVTFLTAGFPTIASTVPLMLAMEKGGANVIELGVPFTDPLADGKAIQDANNVRLSPPFYADREARGERKSRGIDLR